ncbi:hypothetical protein CRM22_001375 [Opisthorchis felineus]|uniref:Uncharacterized protein n=1 Tax=Opisthorchis felineus TaxID=147828 RepID=A0A4S2MHB8_OPIFE|nr:hypothetical protein CRM22_001375 [Opisthorchis felineus]
MVLSLRMDSTLNGFFKLKMKFDLTAIWVSICLLVSGAFLSFKISDVLSADPTVSKCYIGFFPVLSHSTNVHAEYSMSFGASPLAKTFRFYSTSDHNSPSLTPLFFHCVHLLFTS